MKARIFQTEFGPHGNCYSACLASLTGIPLDEIPNFNDVHENQDGSKTPFWNRAREAEWLRARGFSWWGSDGTLVPAGEAIATIKSPREGYHAVVTEGGIVVHDPYPDAPTGYRPESFHAFTFLVSILPDSASP